MDVVTGGTGHENVDTYLPEYARSTDDVTDPVGHLLASSCARGESPSADGGMYFR